MSSSNPSSGESGSSKDSKFEPNPYGTPSYPSPFTPDTPAASKVPSIYITPPDLRQAVPMEALPAEPRYPDYCEVPTSLTPPVDPAGSVLASPTTATAAADKSSAENATSSTTTTSK